MCKTRFFTTFEERTKIVLDLKAKGYSLTAIATITYLPSDVIINILNNADN